METAPFRRVRQASKKVIATYQAKIERFLCSALFLTFKISSSVQMIEFSNYRRNPAAPTLFVNKIAGIYRVSPGNLKVTYALATGPTDVSEVGSLIWPDG